MKEYLTKHKIYLMLFAVCLLVAIASGIFLKIKEQRNNEMNEVNFVNTNPTDFADAQSVTPIQNNTQSPIINHQSSITSSSTAPFFPTPDETKNSVTLKINGKSRIVPISTSTTVYDMMQYYSLIAADSDFWFETKEYSGLGMFVTKIGNVANDAQTGKYWIYYINDEPAKVGISNYILKPNDLIEWKYDNAN